MRRTLQSPLPVPRILVSALSAEYACDLTKEKESRDLAEIDRGLHLCANARVGRVRVEGAERPVSDFLQFYVLIVIIFVARGAGFGKVNRNTRKGVTKQQ